MSLSSSSSPFFRLCLLIHHSSNKWLMFFLYVSVSSCEFTNLQICDKVAMVDVHTDAAAAAVPSTRNALGRYSVCAVFSLRFSIHKDLKCLMRLRLHLNLHCLIGLN